MHAGTNLSQDPHVDIQFAGTKRRGRVVWNKGGRLGFEFERGLSVPELQGALAFDSARG